MGSTEAVWGHSSRWAILKDVETPAWLVYAPGASRPIANFPSGAEAIAAFANGDAG